MANPDHWVVTRPLGRWWALTKLGFRALSCLSMRLLRPKPLSLEEMGALAEKLRDLGIAFGAGHDWSPSQMVLKLRDESLFQGKFTEIFWNSDGWHVRTL